MFLLYFESMSGIFGKRGDKMLYELEYDLDSQIEVNSFVNEDYKEMSNPKAKYYMGKYKYAFAKEPEKTESLDDFCKWLV